MMKKAWESIKALVFSEYAPLVLIYIISEINLIVAFVNSYKAVGSFKGLMDNLGSVVMPYLFNDMFVKIFVGLILIYIILIIARYFITKGKKDLKFSIFLIVTVALTVFAGVCTYIAMFYDQNNLGQLVYRVLYFNFMKDGQSNIKFTLYILYLIIPGLSVLYSLIRLGKLYDEDYLRHLLMTIVFNTFGIMILYFVIATLFAYAWAMLLAAICLGLAYIIGYIAVQDALDLGASKKIQQDATKKKKTKKDDK